LGRKGRGLESETSSAGTIIAFLRNRRKRGGVRAQGTKAFHVDRHSPIVSGSFSGVEGGSIASSRKKKGWSSGESARGQPGRSLVQHAKGRRVFLGWRGWSGVENPTGLTLKPATPQLEGRSSLGWSPLGGLLRGLSFWATAINTPNSKFRGRKSPRRDVPSRGAEKVYGKRSGATSAGPPWVIGARSKRSSTSTEGGVRGGLKEGIWGARSCGPREGGEIITKVEAIPKKGYTTWKKQRGAEIGFKKRRKVFLLGERSGDRRAYWSAKGGAWI